MAVPSIGGSGTTSLSGSSSAKTGDLYSTTGTGNKTVNFGPPKKITDYIPYVIAFLGFVIWIKKR